MPSIVSNLFGSSQIATGRLCSQWPRLSSCVILSFWMWYRRGVGAQNYLHLQGLSQVSMLPCPLIWRIKRKYICYLDDTAETHQYTPKNHRPKIQPILQFFYTTLSSDVCLSSPYTRIQGHKMAYALLHYKVVWIFFFISIYLKHLFIHAWSTYPPIHQLVCPSIIHPPIHPSIHPTIHSSIIHPPIY